MIFSILRIVSSRRKLNSFRTAPPKQKVSKEQLEAEKQDEKVEAIKVKRKRYKKNYCIF